MVCSDGLLHRRHITIDYVKYIGRESNQLEDVDAGLVRANDGYTEYPDPSRDYWQMAVVPALKQISLKAWQRDTGKSAVILIDARTWAATATRDTSKDVDRVCAKARCPQMIAMAFRRQRKFLRCTPMRWFGFTLAAGAEAGTSAES